MVVVTDDAESLRRVVAAYALAVDERDDDAFAQLFVPDGVVELIGPRSRRVAAEFRGHDELKAMVGWLRHYSATFHLVANHLATIDGNSADGTTYCLAHHYLREREEVEISTLRYDDTYVRTAAGWRFTRRRIDRLWNEFRKASSEPLSVDRAAMRDRSG
jgi:hypothetical protein